MPTVMLAVIIGTAFSAVTIFVLLRKLLRIPIHSRVPARAALLAALAASPFAWFLGFILGGNFGGAIGSALGSGQDVENVFTVFGIGFGLYLVMTLAIFFVASLTFYVLKAIMPRAR